MNPDIAKSLDNLRQIWKPETACITCKSWESNHMTKHGMGHCKNDPAWTSRPSNGHCDKHAMADNATERLEWLAKRGKK